MRTWQKIVVFVLIGLIAGGGLGYFMLPSPDPKETKPLVAPGELDSHYAFLSGGKGGDIRVFAVPSMRLIRVIPIFNPSGQYGYARPSDVDTKHLLENSGGAQWGETLFPVLSKTDGDYDGKFLFAQDKAHGRVALVSLKTLETEDVAKVPNMATAFGLTVDPNTKYLISSGQREGKAEEGIVSFLDPHSLKAKFQIAGPEMTVLNGGFDGEKVFVLVPSKNSLGVIDLKAAEAASKNASAVNGVPVIDAAKDAKVLKLVDLGSKPTGITLTADGKYAIIGSEAKQVAIFDTAAEKVVAKPELGSKPVQSTVDSKGNIYTSLQADNQVVKWDLKKAIDGKDYEINRLKVNEKPEYLEVMDSRTKAPTDEWLLVYNQGGTDRFMDVRMDVQNVQVVNISGKDMKLAMDSPVEPQVLDGVAVKAEKLQPSEVFIPNEKAIKEGENSIVRTGPNSVEVRLTAKRTEYGFDEFKVKEGDRVRLTITNIERTKDIIHGFALTEHDVSVDLPPGKTVTVEFVAGKPGVYQYYCTIFCSALHMEMLGRMVVEPR